MKKRTFGLLVLGAAAVILSAAVVAVSVVAGSSAASEVERMYKTLEKEKSNMTDEQYAASFSALLSKIADGSESERASYAAILRKMVGSRYTFADQEVKAFARELLATMEALAKGEVTEGVQSISAEKNGRAILISVGYIDCTKCQIVQVDPEKELIPSGEKLEAYNGALGKNLFKMTLYDAKVSETWQETYRAQVAYSVPGADGLQFMYGCQADHSVTIYIGSDEPLQCVNPGEITLHHVRGTVVAELAADSEKSV